MTQAATEVVQGRRSRVVREDDTAVRWGNDGLYVLSTPAILGHMEQVCVELMTPHLAEGEMTVGVDVQMQHLLPTLMGDTVEFDVTMRRSGRDIAVEFAAVDSRGATVSKGTHRRAVIDKAKFLARLEAQRAKA